MSLADSPWKRNDWRQSMLKHKAFWLLLLAAGGVLRLGLQCWPEPDVSLNLLNWLGTATT
jgi:predicted thioredoxin/glutaredoxin